MVGRLNILPSRHQKNMAKEEAEYAQVIADLEAQITEIRAQKAAATRLHQVQLVANETLLAGIQTKLDSMAPQHPRATTI